MELTIEKLVYGGDGLARLPADEHGRGKAVFLPFVLENEKIEATIVQEKPGFVRARLNRVIEPSPMRTDARCPYFARCGGCHYQHSSYEHQLAIKASILKENLRRIAKLELPSELKIHPSPPWNYRNRTRLRVQTSPEFAVGYYRFGSHALLPVEECPISSSLINRAIAAFSQLGRAGKVDASIREVEFFTNADDTQVLVEVFVGGARKEKQVLRGLKATQDDKRIEIGQPSQASAQEICDAIFATVGVVVFPEIPPGVQTEPEPLAAAGSGELNYQTAAAKYRVSAGSFFQTNRYLTDELVSIVTRGRLGRTALDLYAGVGLFSAVLSREFERVIAVESSQQSSTDLAYNAPVSVKAVRADVGEYLKRAAGKSRPDFVVVDPPRGGLGERVAHSVAELGAPVVTYVSCDPATLARDLVPLLAAGYHVDEAHLVDLFPQTFHLETVLHLAR